MSKRHASNLVEAMELTDYSLADIAPAFPGRSLDQIDTILRDNALALERPVMPYGLLGINACKSEYFNVSEHGFRHCGEEQPWPPDESAINVFFFGGSTGLGQNVPDRDAIPSILRNKLKNHTKKIEVYNLGSGNYTARHECLRFLEIVEDGFVPDIAIFLDGYNDSFYAAGNRELVSALDTLYRGEKRRRRKNFLAAILDFAKESKRNRRKDLPTARTLKVSDPTFKDTISTAAVNAALSASQVHVPAHEIGPAGVVVAKLVWQRYLRSIAMIETLSSSLKTQLLFLWQPVPFFDTTPRQRIMENLYPVYRAGGFSWPVYQWLHAENFPGTAANSRNFINISNAAIDFNDICYVDVCHYSPTFSDVIASRILEPLIERIENIGA